VVRLPVRTPPAWLLCGGPTGGDIGRKIVGISLPVISRGAGQTVFNFLVVWRSRVAATSVTVNLRVTKAERDRGLFDLNSDKGVRVVVDDSPDPVWSAVEPG
jgi:hypothetical protein